MRCERAQATVEYVGIVLAVGLLLGATAALLGGGQLARAVADALAAAMGASGTGGARPGAAGAIVTGSPVDLALFAAATDASLPDDRRPTLRDVRLRFEEELGPEAGDVLLRRLLVAQVADLRPGTNQLVMYPPTLGALLSPETIFARAPPHGQHDTERPLGATTLHLTTAAEQAAYLRTALHPGYGAADVIDALTHLPIPVVKQVFQVAGIVSSAAAELSSARERLVRTSGIDAGAQEGDAIACWVVLRTRPTGSDSTDPTGEHTWNARSHHYFHVAIVRNGVVVGEYLIPDPRRDLSCNFS